MSIEDIEREVYDYVQADTLQVGDQTIIDGDAVIITFVDQDRDDINEVYVKFDNLTGDADDAELFFSDDYALWSL